MQFSGTFTTEVPTDRIGREVAVEVVRLFDSTGMIPAIAAAVVRELHATTAGDATYERESEPDPGAGPRRGVAGYGDVTDDGLSE